MGLLKESYKPNISNRDYLLGYTDGALDIYNAFKKRIDKINQEKSG